MVWVSFDYFDIRLKMTTKLVVGMEVLALFDVTLEHIKQWELSFCTMKDYEQTTETATGRLKSIYAFALRSICRLLSLYTFK